MSKLTPSLRKAAILISSLDTRSADQLLDQMSPDQAAQIRDAVMELPDIDPLEQERVIQEFVGRPSAQTHDHSADIELDISFAGKMNSAEAARSSSTHEFTRPNSATSPAPKTAAKPSFQTLLNTPPEKLAAYLQNEHPQLIALVMAHLPPERAADVLSELPAELRVDVIQRVSQVSDANSDILEDVERGLSSRLQSDAAHSQTTSVGLSAAQAILAASRHNLRDELAQQMAGKNRELSQKLGLVREIQRSDAANILPLPTTRSMPTPVANLQGDASRSIRPAIASKVSESIPEIEDVEDEEETPIAAGPTLDFQDMAMFDNQSLAAVLRNVNPQVALLALTGADPALIDRILKQLPSRDARAFRTRLRSLGPLRISDVLEAQEQFARSASQLIAKGILRDPSAKRSAVAA